MYKEVINISDYEKAVYIVKNKDYTKANKKFLMNMVLDVYPCSLILDELRCTVTLDLKNRLVIEPMSFYDTISNL